MGRRDSALGFPATVDPGIVRSTDNMSLPAANAAIFSRVRDAGPVSKIGYRVLTQSGNLSLAVYRNTGRGREARPGTRLATTGAFVCPVPGYYEQPLGSSLWVHAGDWLAITADNTTATFHSLLAAGADSDIGKGRQYRQATAHPAPAAAGTLVPTVGYAFVLVGVR